MPSTIDAPPTPAAPHLVPDVWSTSGGLSFDDTLDMTRRVLRRKHPDRVTHKQVVKIAQRLCDYGWVCRFFTLQVEDAAVRVNGECADDYALPVGIAIVKDFCDRWNGCPEEACRG